MRSIYGLVLLYLFTLVKSQSNCKKDTFFININKDIEAISNCSTINGSLFINGENNIDSLSGLSNINYITGELVIIDSHIVNSLKGLHNLKNIGGENLYLDQYSVAIKHNINNKNDSHQGLCYVNKLDWSLLTNSQYTFSNNGKNCPDCHSNCLGCFGPGPRLCQQCRYFQLW